MLGHVLRQLEQNGASSSLVFAHKIIKSQEIKVQVGRNRQNLYDAIIKEIENVGLAFESALELPSNEKEWEKKRDFVKENRKSQRLATKKAYLKVPWYVQDESC